MSKTLLVAAVAAALVCASATGYSARERSRPVRKVKAPGSDRRTKPVVPTADGNGLLRRGATVYEASSAAEHRPRTRSAPRPATGRAHSDAVRAHAWAYAARLRRTGRTLWSVMFGLGVGLSQAGVQLGKSLSGKPLETFLDTITSPHVIVASLVPSLLAVLAGELLRNRYTGRAEAIEASVRESHQADHGQ